MKIEFLEVAGVKRVLLVGRLDTAGVDLVETRFSAGVTAGGRNTMLDLSELEFLASLGVRMLISTARALHGSGGRLVMYGARENVADVIETMGLDEIIPAVATEAEALARLST